MVDQDHWDPLPSERQYVRSSTTGDLGYLVRREGQDKVRLDRPMQEVVQPYREGSWVPEREYKPFSLHQVVHVAFEADKHLCRMLGLHKESKAEWLSLKEAERIKWMQDGPGSTSNSLRSELYLGVMSVLRKHAR